MKIADIIALAKSGYKVSEIKELMSLGETQQSDEPAEIPAEAPAQPEPEKAGPEPAGEPAPSADQSAEIDELKKQIAGLKADLATAQKQNTAADLSDGAQTHKNTQEAVNDIMKHLY